MKKEKGWCITTFQVKVKHRPFSERRYLALDLAETLRDRDDVKEVRAKIKRKKDDAS